MRRAPALGLLVAAALGALGAGRLAAATAPEVGPWAELQFLGEARLPTGMTFAGTEVGGLSSLTYDRTQNVFLAISDDDGEKAPVRFYTLAIDLADGQLGAGDVTVRALTFIHDREGRPFEPGSLDPEGLTLGPEGRLFFSSEGRAPRGIPPTVREISREGALLRDFVVPSDFAPGEEGRVGTRRNQGFESLAVSADGRELWVASEGPLAQDGPEPTRTAGARVRLLRFDLQSERELAHEHYAIDPLPADPTPPDGLKVSGLVEILPLGGARFLALERAYVEGYGFRIRLYLADLESGGKSLLFDFASLGTAIDNVEGLCFGPELPDGRRTLLLVSDNNFSATEITQFFAFAVSPLIVGRAGRNLPPVAGAEAVAFWRGLEGRFVEVRDPVIVGPSEGGSFAVLADGGEGVSVRTARGGLLERQGDPNPERIVVDTRLLSAAPLLSVGDRGRGPLRGMVDFRAGTYRLLPFSLPPFAPGGIAAEVTALRGGRDRLTVATFNVENLSAVSSPDKIAKVAAVIARHLGGPDIVSLQEIQDDSGPADDGTVSARRTLTALTRAIVAAGGPRYRAVQIDPADNTSGGRPGGNIRPAILIRRGRGLRLAAPPRVIGADDPCFLGDSARKLEPSRRPLVVELSWKRRRLVVLGVHLLSKSADDRLLGRHQPPLLASEEQRTCQAERIVAFVRELAAADPAALLIAAGDFNEVPFRRPMLTLRQAPLADALAGLPEGDRTTYVFEGNSEQLDHLLVSPSLEKAVVGADVVHVHAEFPAAERASDHDPLIIALDSRRLPRP